MGLPDKQDNTYFKTTRWTLISQMRNLDAAAARELQNQLYKDYWKPICRYIVSKGNSQDEASDLTQEFFFNQVIRNSLFEKAYSSKGKFRSLLLVALNNFLVSQNRRDSADKRSPEFGMVSLEHLESLHGEVPVSCQSEEEQFNYTWIQTILENTVARLKEHYRKKTPVYWDVFYMRVLEPIFNQTEVPSMEEVCQKTGVSDVHTASNIIITVKRKFQSELRCHIREYVATEEEIGVEISNFSRFLKKIMQDS